MQLTGPRTASPVRYRLQRENLRSSLIKVEAKEERQSIREGVGFAAAPMRAQGTKEDTYHPFFRAPHQPGKFW